MTHSSFFVSHQLVLEVSWHSVDGDDGGDGDNDNKEGGGEGGVGGSGGEGEDSGGLGDGECAHDSKLGAAPTAVAARWHSRWSRNCATCTA